MLAPDDETLAKLTPAGLEEWIQGTLHDLPVAARESIASFLRRQVVCDALLARLVGVPPYGWAEWVALDRSIREEQRRDRRDQLHAERSRVQAQRALIAAPVRDFITLHTALLKVIESEHPAAAAVRGDQPANHILQIWRRGIFDFRTLTALRAVNLCPVIGVECVEAARAFLLRVRTLAERGAAETLERYVPDGDRPRAPASTPEPSPGEIMNLDGSLKETVRKILVALRTPASKHQVVADRAVLSLDEVKRWSTTLKAHHLVTHDKQRNWCLTPKGEELLRSNE